MTVLHDAVHVAHKRHHCDQCGKRIEKGERYRKNVNTYDGFGTYKAHEDCDLASRHYNELANLLFGEYCVLQDDLTLEDQEWVTKEFPFVAQRMWGTEVLGPW